MADVPGPGGSTQGIEDKAKRDRSPSFPYIGLAKAVERIETLFVKAKRHEVRVADVAKDWGLAPKSSSTDRNVAALLAYGLAEDSGSGETRKIKISEMGWRVIDDKRPGVRDKLLAEAAIKPKIIAEYSHYWKDGRPDDAHALSQLKFEGGFTDEGARMFLRVFDETIRFVTREGADSSIANDADTATGGTRATVGDFIQWTNNGIDQFKTPARVVALSDDAQWLWVEGSSAGISMSEVQVTHPPPVPPMPSMPSTGGPPPPPASVLSALNPKSRAMREEKFALKEGDVVISFPEGLSADSVEDLDDYIQVFLKKARREAGAMKKND